ncbi:hypothetical protein RirG_101230 [Rhizophagus irregularis DAOM 197198w]|uniref:Uncharacterized protein n=1 Tax=Rhizophagus irregularis (strain DAOM 197198w) TaxID=1432141 RepID=A0A015JH75_RHIIW|nr:hypothetical protein RirG_101230 [Rhizophagus irregularis DAOM 197198w]
MNVDNNIPCQWMYTLEGNCKEKNLLIKILNISAICYGILALKNVFFIIWRVYLRKVEKRGCAPLDYMVTFAFIFNLLRSVDNFIVVYNLFPEAIIFRVSFFAISWIPGATVIYLYLAVVFRTIPRLILHRLTCKENTLWILNTKKITPVLWTLSTITSIGLISSSVLAGYFLKEQKVKEMIIAFSAQMESLTLAGMNDERKDIEKKKFDIYIHKMKMFNYIFGGISLFVLYLREFKSRNLEGRKEPVHSTWMQTEISYQNLSRHI